MRTFPRRRPAIGAPSLPVATSVVISLVGISVIGVSVAAAVVLVGVGVFTPTGRLTANNPPLLDHDPQTTSWVIVAAIARVVMFTAGAIVMRRRAQQAGPETAVWRWLTRAAILAVGASIVAAGLDITAAHGISTSTLTSAAVGSAIFNLGVLAACPLLYQALIHWNRYGTLTAEPGDWLNGLGAVFALAALGNLAILWLHSPLSSWPAWQLQLWLVRVAAELMVVGTAATILIIGGLLRDVRAWTFTLAVTLTAGVDAAHIGDPAAATGTAPYSDLGYATLVVVLVICATLPAPAPLPRPSTSEAPTAGSFIILLASISVLVGTGLLIHTHTPGSTVWWATLWAGTAAAAVSLRGLHSIHLLAHLLISRHEALTDDLTGLANRRALDRRLIEDTTAGHPFTLMIIDLDGFKQINDRFGHAVGDEVLRRTGRLLHTVVHAPALAARLGGDEFAVVFPGHSLPAAKDVFAALYRATREPVQIDGRRLLLQGSVGIATTEPGDTPEQVLRHADAAMYRAKTAGGARYEVHDEAAAHHAAQQAQLVEELKALLGARDARDDVETGQLLVYYQPQLSRTGRVVGAEALVRWDHPRLGVLTPDAFLDHVEDYGLMHALTTEVMQQAIHQVARWRSVPPHPGRNAGHDAGQELRISVNLSATSLTHPDLLGLVDRLLTESGLTPAALVLEITETSIMVEPEESIARLHDLAGRGIAISIDDYGSGYSSLAYLNNLPASELKLDRSLTQQVTTTARTADIVAGTVALAHRLGLRVVAEGVEDTTMLAALHELGCDETQGFLHARPMNAEAFTARLTLETTAVTAPSATPLAAPDTTPPPSRISISVPSP